MIVLEKWQVDGIVSGMEDSGAKFRKIEPPFIYFDIPKGSEIDNDDKLQIAYQAIKGVLGLRLKIKRIE